MIERSLKTRLQSFATKFPVVTVTEPRQSGKTTLCRAEFPDKPYVSLEAPDIREFARLDPRGFLDEHQDGALLDEVHRVPKLHFVDTGLVCYLLGIRSPEQLRDHPLRGMIFETWVASEILKSRVHRGLQPNLSFFRDRKGAEVDLVVELGPDRCERLLRRASRVRVGSCLIAARTPGSELCRIWRRRAPETVPDHRGPVARPGSL